MTTSNKVSYSDYMAGMQRDDESVGIADLIAAYEQGINDLRTAVAGITAEQVLEGAAVGYGGHGRTPVIVEVSVPRPVASAPCLGSL